MKDSKNLFRDSVRKYTNSKISKQTIVKNIFFKIDENETILSGPTKLKSKKIKKERNYNIYS